MTQFIEVLRTGMTVAGMVRRAGAQVQVSDAFKIESKKKQVKRWGQPRYREISRADFTSTGQQVLQNDPDAVEAEPVAEAPALEGSFAELDGLNVEDTLAAVATFGDEKLASFIEFEKATSNRVGVLGALEA